MNRTLFLIGLLFLLSSNQSKHSHGTHKHSDQPAKSQDTKIENVKLTGDLIGLTCFVRHNSKGHDHKSCARECAEKGLPIGLLVDNKIYQISAEGHASLIEAYKPLLDYLEDTVTAEGLLFEKQGIRLLTIKNIEKKVKK